MDAGPEHTPPLGLPDASWCRDLANDWSPDLLAVVDPDLRVVWTNPAVTGLLGYERGDLWGTPVLEFVHPEDVPSVLGAVSEAHRRHGYHLATRVRLRHSSGAWVGTRATAATVSVDGATWMVLSVRSVEDEVAIEQRRRRLKALAQSVYVECAGMQHKEEVHRSTSLLATLGAVLGADSVELAEVVAADPCLLVRSEWGHRRVDLAYGVRGTRTRPLTPVEVLQDVPCALAERGDSTHVEIWLPEHHGRSGVVCIGFSPLPYEWDDANADLVALMCSTILATVARCSQERETVRAATRDPLTGLLNRRALHDRLRALMGDGDTEGGVLSLAFADLNNFKSLNDSHGHLEGDRVLVAVADAITGSIRTRDVAARVGGDEFVVVFRSDPAAVERLIQRLRDNIGAAMSGWEEVSIAIGAISVGTHDTPEDVLHSADLAMYHDKHSMKQREVDDDGAQPSPGGDSPDGDSPDGGSPAGPKS